RPFREHEEICLAERADPQDAAGRLRLDAVGFELVVRARPAPLDQLCDRVQAVEPPRIDLDAGRGEGVEAGASLVNLFLERCHTEKEFPLCGSCVSFLRMASSIPLTNLTASSVLNVRASSSASSITTAGGVSGSRSISQMAIRSTRRSSTAMRS